MCIRAKKLTRFLTGITCLSLGTGFFDDNSLGL